MNLIKLIFCAFVLNLFAIGINGQIQGDVCPTVSMIEPAAIVSEGDLMTFSVEVKGLPESANLTFNWTVSNGAIVSGQGTKAINVSTEALGGQNIIATVEIKGDGFLDSCNTNVSGAGVVAEKEKARLFVRMENPNCEGRQANIDGFFVELSNNPNAIGYIFTFGSPRTVVLQEKAMRTNINFRRFDINRVVFVNGGGRSKKPTIEFWIVPAGAEAPKPEMPIENEADFDTAEKNTEIVRNPKEPYIFSSEYYDGGACFGENTEIDLEGYARFLKDNPKARGNIVILMMSKSEFREKEKEILDFLKSKGIARNRLRTFHKESFGGIELWILP